MRTSVTTLVGLTVIALFATGCSMNLSITDTNGEGNSPRGPASPVDPALPGFTNAETIVTNNGYTIRGSVGEIGVETVTTSQGYVIRGMVRE